MATTAETLRAYQGPSIFSYGFRPFFLGGAIWAAAAMIFSSSCSTGSSRFRRRSTPWIGMFTSCFTATFPLS